MRRSIVSALLVSITGAVIAAGATLALYRPPAEVAVEMDRTHEAGTTGLYPPERDGSLTFAWTRRAAGVVLPGLDRRVEAECVVRLSGSRPPGLAVPSVRIAADGRLLVERQAPAAYDDLLFTVAAAPGATDLTLRLEVSGTFRPGPSDTRVLGVAIDRIACRPGPGASTVPPVRAMAGPALAAALMGGSVALGGASLPAALAVAAVSGTVPAWLVVQGPAAYRSYPDKLWLLALGVALALHAALLVARRFTREPLLSGAARFAVIVSAAFVFLKLATLLHPLKASVDVVFQANRFDWVLDGRFFFTSLTPGLYQFPYGISLYLVAAPFAWTTSDHASLLRVVTCAAEAVAGLLIYAMVARTWGDRLVAAAAMAAFHLVPISYSVVGAANLTNAFGEHVAVATVAALTLAPIWSPLSRTTLAIGTLAALAFVSHLGTFALFATMLCATVGWMVVAGGPALRLHARAVAAVAAVGVVVATAGYYGHFWSVYVSQAERVLGESRRPAAEQGTDLAVENPASAFADDLDSLDPDSLVAARRKAAERTVEWRKRPVTERLGSALAQARKPLGVPLLLLAAVGTAWIVAARRRDRLVWALAGWATMWLAFLLLGVFTPVRMRNHLAAVPALAVLAAAGAAWLWRAGAWGRVVAIATGAWAFQAAARLWLRWVVPS